MAAVVELAANLGAAFDESPFPSSPLQPDLDRDHSPPPIAGQTPLGLTLINLTPS